VRVKGTSVGNVGQLVTKEGVPFDLQARYYQIAGGRNGAISITEKHRVLIEEISNALAPRSPSSVAQVWRRSWKWKSSSQL